MVRGTGRYKGVSLYAILIAVNFSREVQQENIIRVLVNMRGTVGEKKKEMYDYQFCRGRKTYMLTKRKMNHIVREDMRI